MTFETASIGGYWRRCWWWRLSQWTRYEIGIGMSKVRKKRRVACSSTGTLVVKLFHHRVSFDSCITTIDQTTKNKNVQKKRFETSYFFNCYRGLSGEWHKSKLRALSLTLLLLSCIIDSKIEALSCICVDRSIIGFANVSIISQSRSMSASVVCGEVTTNRMTKVPLKLAGTQCSRRSWLMAFNNASVSELPLFKLNTVKPR